MTEQEFITAAADALRKANSPQNAARRIYVVCRKAAKAWGMKPDIECKVGRGYVNFEAGPYDWAVAVSQAANDKVWAEPYYGFDLYFYSTNKTAVT
jgi:hypothetical protein